MNIQQIMKQAQMMQQKINDIQSKLANTEFTGHAGGDMVTVVINGKHEMLSININKTLVNPEEVDVLEDLVVTAFNNAKKKADEASESETSGAFGGLGMPPGFKLPF
jgi:DNA-binding YbaB/EbfC family protein